MMESARRALGTPERIIVAVVVSMTVSAGLFLPLGPVAYASAGKSGGTGSVEEKLHEPTTLAITLEGAGQSGPSVTVPEEAHVAAVATLSGVNASTARGPISYRVYSDSGCMNETAVAGSRSVRTGGSSRAVGLPPGTYYWQASYRGDALDQPSVSPCGAAIETVEGDPPPAPCNSAWGHMLVDTGEGRLGVREELTTDLAAQQRLYAWWSGKHRLRLTRLLDASCVARKQRTVFRGRGEAKLDGVPGYFVGIWIRVSTNGTEVVRLHVHNWRHELDVSLTGFPAPGSETIE
jgi:hypothetical protein